jgi:uncharacterized protein (DUF1800 family)
VNTVQNFEIDGARVARFTRGAVATAVLVFVAACGGGSGGGGGSPTDLPGGETPPEVIAVQKPSPTEASRFLAQATMGGSDTEISRLTGMTYAEWLDEQFAKPQVLHRVYINQAAADLSSVGQQLSNTNFWDSWWAQALGGDDQLRQRVAFALSEIMVISFGDATLRNQTRGVASYYDMLGENAFGSFRKLLEDVTYHPMMGVYLSHLKNTKEDPATGKVPDLNFAREITQLFTIGQYQLNADGTNVMGADGRPLPAYKSADLEGQSQVYTGLSWYAGPALTDRTPQRFRGEMPNLERDWRPMQAYDEYTPNTSYHSINEKKFLGTTIPAMTKPTTDADIKIALDTLFNHPNVGPFIGKLLIQRLVTSNPSPAYVARVSAAFANNGSGVRGDMKAVVKAILLDPEARAVSTAASAGKVREPVLRLAQMLRAFNAKSVSGRYTGIGLTDDPSNSLGQTPMYAPTVFNFFRPGYVPVSQTLMTTNLVVPELQIVTDVSVAGYQNYIRTWTTLNATRDIKHEYTAELALAETPAALVERMNLLLFHGSMPATLKADIESAVASRVIPGPAYPPGTAASAIPTTEPTNKAAMDAARQDRVYLAVFLSMASPDYLIQK